MTGLFIGLILPFLGTALGASCVFLMKDHMPARLQKALTGFAAGVMVAASVWSLLIPSMEMTGADGIMKVIPALTGFLFGIGFLLLLDSIVPHLHPNESQSEGPRSHLSKTTKMAFAITLHNIPEGMAVGVALAGALEHNAYITMSGAVALSLGIAIQNFPEGAIISVPVYAQSKNKMKSFTASVLSGVVEPVSAALTILLFSVLSPALPYLLAFAAGAMIYVVVEELIPEASLAEHSNLSAFSYAMGFAVMMVLDIVC